MSGVDFSRAVRCSSVVGVVWGFGHVDHVLLLEVEEVAHLCRRAFEHQGPAQIAVRDRHRTRRLGMEGRRQQAGEYCDRQDAPGKIALAWPSPLCYTTRMVSRRIRRTVRIARLVAVELHYLLLYMGSFPILIPYNLFRAFLVDPVLERLSPRFRTREEAEELKRLIE